MPGSGQLCKPGLVTRPRQPLLSICKMGAPAHFKDILFKVTQPLCGWLKAKTQHLFTPRPLPKGPALLSSATGLGPWLGSQQNQDSSFSDTEIIY